ncbi:hypothetical protein [Atopomonas sediminilitoris]|uniref:hypothetical protein n=1 Tax=Atopomonas sediminilitoris TaxID=2919919 RepID=UPI001F4EDE2D|nr:hypothetical protein [Atopomonas sediminilitoris]MCJ8169936.1 hypothetical protein [Atopomonas sediminilitoris]
MSATSWQALSSHPEVHHARYLVPNFASNSIAINTAPQQWLVISPGASVLDEWPGAGQAPDQAQAQTENKLELSIILPNSFHYMGVSAWQARYPQAKLYASRHAIARLSSKGLHGIHALEEQQPLLPANYSFKIPPGHRGGDVWLCKTGVAEPLWITCDSFLNYARFSRQPVARLLQKALDAAPGLKISQVVKWFIMDQRQDFKAWALAQLSADQPQWLIPSHGEVAHQTELAQHLRQLLETRL